MNNKEKFYPEARFGGFTDIDGTVAFFNRVNSLLASSFVVLDLGCGRGAYDKDPVPIRKNLRILKGKVAKVIGIDVDPRAQNNPFLDEFHLIQGDYWPIESDSIDLIVCDNVLEHIENTNQFFSETSRILTNGGYFPRWRDSSSSQRSQRQFFWSDFLNPVKKGTGIQNQTNSQPLAG